MSDWKTFTLAELGEFRNGANFSKNAYGHGYPIVNVKQLYSGRFIESDGLRELDRNALKHADRLQLQNGDILFARSSMVASGAGQVAMVSKVPSGTIFSGFIIRFRPTRTDLVQPLFLNYLLRSPSYRERLVRTGTGTSITNLSQDILGRLPVRLPSRAVQEATSEVLDELDEKIELNRQTARTLEELAQRLFKSWFVDFDPVRAKMAGRQPAHTPPEIAELFPDHLVDSPLGPIPEGWTIKPIEEVVSIKGGATPSTKEQTFWDGGNYNWATPKDLSGLQQKVLIKTERKITSAGVEKISSGQLSPGTVLMSSRAPVGYLALADLPVSINQGFIAMICDQGVPNTFVLHWAEANMDVIKSNAGGSTFAEISKKQFRPLEVIVPPAPLLQAFDDVAADWFQRVSQLAHENVTLTQLRDRLLPRLISGEIRVPEAQEMAEET